MTRRTLLATLPAAALGAANEHLVYFGTYTRETSKGIYVSRFNTSTGKLTTPELAGEMTNPSFVTIHPNSKFLYAVGESGSGAVRSYSLDRATGKLTEINTVPAKGTSPCHLVVDATGKNLLVVNYGSGSSVVFPVKTDGSLGDSTAFVQHQGSSVSAARQKSPHAHSVNLSKDNKYAVVADLGTDEFIVYAFDAGKGTLSRHSAAKVKGGAGPRHFSFHPSFKYAYGLGEMGSTVFAFRWDAGKGALTEIESHSTLPADFKGENNCAEILVHPSGKFVYASNRGHDSLAMFSIDQSNGKLKPLGQVSTQGKVPRNFRIDPTGKWLIAANQNSSNLVTYRVDQSSGVLTPTGDQTPLSMPVCIRFL